MNHQPGLDIRKEGVRPYLELFGLHLLLLTVAYICFGIITGHSLIPGSYSFLNWDAVHYNSIRTNGYFYNPFAESNVAFFPGFPYLWKFLHFGISGIMLFNFLLFAFSLLLISYSFRISPRLMMLYCSIPSIFFLYMPYSEALFFFTSALILAGMNNKKRWLGASGFFLSSITRSAANVFIPAIILTELLTPGNKRKWGNIIVYSASCIAGVLLVIYIQHSQTGEWFGFIKTQKYWGHCLRLPKFPLGTTEGMLFFDAAALAVGIGAIATLVCIFWKVLSKRAEVYSKAWLFSALYLAGVTILSLAYKGQSIYSLNRYIFPTLFCMVFFNKGIWLPLKNWNFLGALFLGLTVLWAVFNAFTNIQILLRFMILSLYFCFFLAVFHTLPGIRKMAFALIYSLNLFLQVYLLYRFMDCGWVG